jgi:hypothetical protein
MCLQTLLADAADQACSPATVPPGSPSRHDSSPQAEGHRIAFNEAFRRKGLDHEWSLEQYGVLLEIGGGKERMNAYFSQCGDREPWASITGRLLQCAQQGSAGWASSPPYEPSAA